MTLAFNLETHLYASLTFPNETDQQCGCVLAVQINVGHLKNYSFLFFSIIVSTVESVLLSCSVFCFGASNYLNYLLVLQSVKQSWS